VQEVVPLLHLLPHRGPLGAHLVGPQQKRDLTVEAIQRLGALVRRGVGAAQGGEQVGDVLLFAEDRAAARLRGVGREGGLDVELLEQAHHLVERVALILQVRHRRVDRLGARLRVGRAVLLPRSQRPLRGAGRPGPLTVDADDLLLLRLVDEVEEGGVDVQEPLQRVLVQLGNAACRLLALLGGVLLLRLLAERPQPLHVLEEGRPTLLLRDATEHAAKKVDLTAQGLGDAGAFGVEVEVVPAAHREVAANVKGVYEATPNVRPDRDGAKGRARPQAAFRQS
jgi:hypothetical protein